MSDSRNSDDEAQAGRVIAGMRNRALGLIAEEQAAAYLRGQGYAIHERNWKCKAGEIDIVALKAEFLCFVEVKRRKAGDFATALESITPAKQRKIIQTARWYLLSHQSLAKDRQPRFDVLAIDVAANGDPTYTLIEHAFQTNV